MVNDWQTLELLCSFRPQSHTHKDTCFSRKLVRPDMPLDMIRWQWSSACRTEKNEKRYHVSPQLAQGEASLQTLIMRSAASVGLVLSTAKNYSCSCREKLHCRQLLGSAACSCLSRISKAYSGLLLAHHVCGTSIAFHPFYSNHDEKQLRDGAFYIHFSMESTRITK